jgi:hypothetical protein
MHLWLFVFRDKVGTWRGEPELFSRAHSFYKDEKIMKGCLDVSFHVFFTMIFIIEEEMRTFGRLLRL